MNSLRSGVTAPKGFLASGIYCGIKKSGRDDLGLLYSEVPAVVSAAFTTNNFAASPIKVSKKNLKAKHHQAIIINSGNANCANGKIGDADARLMVRLAARALGLRRDAVLVASTGIIGHRLPVGKIRRALPLLAKKLSAAGGGSFAKAILTTDTMKKETVSTKVRLKGASVTIGGAAKGVGMIYPKLNVARHATLLCFLTTDADIETKMLDLALAYAMDRSFNMISVDGDMSTNDSVFLMANGLAGNHRIKKPGRDFDTFKEALAFAAQVLAKKVVLDGEGATKVIEVRVKGSRCYGDASAIARKITTSNLLKACVYGEDPNWGRIAAAAGSSGVSFDPDKVDIYLGGVKVLSKGARVPTADKKTLKSIFRNKEVPITVDLNSGRSEAMAWTCDLSEEYVRINAAYST